eukprot:CAMPEP_0119288560 /NCGR_PEP_ID=MMETSP1329-20130426/37493_1 /TAXON_ID=114041 /ORGANISM="Genus nov. species nov., Strain RCC1024" /LENGTH=182 /DNA_ID=CAMNT_0007289341 /DNA_START=93 /DNA_END=637 /DNA_ORIENTATION=+
MALPKCALLAHMLLATASCLRPIARRAALQQATAGALLTTAAPALARTEEDNEKLRQDIKAPPGDSKARECGSRLVGTYTDPKHPGCTRRVAQIGGTRFASIRGVDEDGIPWVAGATVACAGYNGIDSEQLIVDFSKRGGGTEVVALAKYTASSATLTFPDGNVWTMVPCSNPNIKTKQQMA